jgi:pimeloyl-ACP methyl ester carboxylesterase
MEYINGEPLRDVAFFPGIPGSRLFHLNAFAFNTWNIRLLVVERPGLGLSTNNPRKSIKNWADDFRELLDALGIQQVCLLAYSAGGPAGLSVAHAMPDRITRVAIVSSVSPRDVSTAAYTGMPFTFKLAWFSAAHMPFLLRLGSYLDQKSVLENAVEAHVQSLALAAPCDHELMLSNEIQTLFCESSLELAARNQYAAIAEEYKQWGRPWGFKLSGKVSK